MERRIVIIDGNSLINRAYYAMQRPMMTKEGLYTQGVYGFLNMLTKIEKDYEPEYLAVTFDRKAPTFRHLEYDAYKAGRKKMPPELAMQLPLLKEVLTAMRIHMLEIDGFEADDLIGTIAGRAEEAGLLPLIITGDRDELQLASDVTKVLITKKGISEFELYDRQAMIDVYGFTPQQFIDYKGLRGDPSDNIPGVPGVGEKTATKLILEYGSIENLIANLDTMSNQKLKEKLEENVQLAVMSKRLATINTEVPIDFDFADFKVTEPDYDALISVYTKLEFNSFLKRLSRAGKTGGAKQNAAAKKTGDAAGVRADSFKTGPEFRAAGAEANTNASAAAGEIGTVFVNSDETLENLLSGLDTEKAAVIKLLGDQNHTAKPMIFGLSLLLGNTFYYIDGKREDALRAVVRRLFSAPGETAVSLSGHDLKKDYYTLLSLYSEDFGCGDGTETCFRTAFDTAVAAYVLEPSKSSYSMTVLAYEYFHEEIEDEEKFLAAHAQLGFLSGGEDELCAYCLRFCKAARALSAIFAARIESENLAKVYYEIELPLIEVMASMEANGFAVDKAALQAIGEEITGGVAGLAERIYEDAGEEFNINSPQQLGVILFEKLGLPAGKKTKKGYSTSADVLEKLRDRHPIIDRILEYRTLSKLKSTYIEGLTPLIGTDGRIHAHFQQTVTATGRISCTEPNLQNIPVKQELGRRLRRAFVPGQTGWSLVGADYSQIELRVLAHLSGDAHMIGAFNNGEDIHRSTAAKVFDVPIDEVTPAQRSASKAVNFGVIYGMSSFGLSSEIHVSRKEAEQYIAEYFRRFPDVKRFMDRQVEECRRDGYLTTIMGRRRYIPEIGASAYMVRQLGERLAMNSPIQGSAADIIKLAMIAVYRKIRSEKLAARLILQVHDELIIETPEEERETVTRLLTECMENVMTLAVKLSVGVSSGTNWYELK